MAVFLRFSNPRGSDAWHFKALTKSVAKQAISVCPLKLPRIRRSLNFVIALHSHWINGFLNRFFFWNWKVMKYQFRLTSPMKDVDKLLEPNMIVWRFPESIEVLIPYTNKLLVILLEKNAVAWPGDIVKSYSVPWAFFTLGLCQISFFFLWASPPLLMI